MLFDTLDKIKRRVIMMAIVLMFVGNILMIFPEAYLSELSVIFSFILFVIAVITVFRFLGSRHSLMNYVKLTLGLFAGLLGMIFLVYDDVLLRMLSFLVSFLPIVLGSFGIYHAFAFARSSGRRGWWIPVCLSAFLMLFGTYNILFPWVDTHEVYQVVGSTMMFSAFVCILSLIWLWPAHKKEAE